ncbi:hypothetical protein ACP70R_037609 [Stipagrostis hirtigluma subsp. patula]
MAAEPSAPDRIPCMNLNVDATGVYRFKVQGYSITRTMATKDATHYYQSEIFSVGSYSWAVRYYPYNGACSNVCVRLVLLGPRATGRVAVTFACTPLGKSGEPSVEMEKVSSEIIDTDDDSEPVDEVTWSWFHDDDLAKFVVGDSIVLQCAISVLKWPKK